MGKWFCLFFFHSFADCSVNTHMHTGKVDCYDCYTRVFSVPLYCAIIIWLGLRWPFSCHPSSFFRESAAYRPPPIHRPVRLTR
uniref:Putative secreted protein n=1 Tax=Anopheles marajoara TaxID=58244 RepID=A0A2M4CBA5_9DIPT